MWSDFNKYIAGENSVGRTTTGFSFNVTKEQAEKVQSHFSSLLVNRKPQMTGPGMQRFRIADDYKALTSNCTTISLTPLERAFPGLQSGAEPYVQGTGLNGMESAAAHLSGDFGSRLFMPGDAKAYLESDVFRSKLPGWNVAPPKVTTYKLGRK